MHRNLRFLQEKCLCHRNFSPMIFAWLARTPAILISGRWSIWRWAADIGSKRFGVTSAARRTLTGDAMAVKAAIASRRVLFAFVRSLGDADGPHRPSLAPDRKRVLADAAAVGDRKGCRGWRARPDPKGDRCPRESGVQPGCRSAMSESSSAREAEGAGSGSLERRQARPRGRPDASRSFRLQRGISTQ